MHTLGWLAVWLMAICTAVMFEGRRRLPSRLIVTFSATARSASDSGTAGRTVDRLTKVNPAHGRPRTVILLLKRDDGVLRARRERLEDRWRVVEPVHIMWDDTFPCMRDAEPKGEQHHHSFCRRRRNHCPHCLRQRRRATEEPPVIHLAAVLLRLSNTTTLSGSNEEQTTACAAASLRKVMGPSLLGTKKSLACSKEAQDLFSLGAKSVGSKRPDRPAS
jgi:hypothetical protein